MAGGGRREIRRGSGKRVPAEQWPRVSESGVALSVAIFAVDMTSDVWDTPYEFPEADPIPADLETALEAARESDFLKGLLGDDRFEILAGQAERELAFMDAQVTQVETDRYLRNF